MKFQSAVEGQIGDGPKTASDLNNEIIKQGDIVRNLKTQKAAKAEVDKAVKILLSLKADYKNLTNTEWKPGGCQAPSSANKPKVVTKSDLSQRIKAQNDKVMMLKEKNTTKPSIIEAEIKILNGLKTEFLQKFNGDWMQCLMISKETKQINILNDDITIQGNKIRELKAKKRDKAIIDAEIKVLLDLKNDYKVLSGKEWKPAAQPKAKLLIEEDALLKRIKEQGEIVRNLKAVSNLDKSIIAQEVQVLLKLKDEYKEKTGKDWEPGMKSTTPPREKLPPEVEAKLKEFNELNSKKLTDETELINCYKEAQKLMMKHNRKSPVKVVEAKKKPSIEEDSSSVKKQTRLGLEAKKEENLSDWYTQVLTKAELIEYYDVSGCYILRPWSYTIWESIKQWFDVEIKKLDVENCYFPIFVSKSVLEKEKTHIADFSPEVAWVTKSGDSDMAEPIAIRPTSETVMYPAYAKWIQSYRDLPIKLNQWNNVVRWEFKHPQPFLRTREFLWQEGHTAYASETDAKLEVETIIKLYEKIYTDLLAIPVIVGKKTEKEKFAGGDYTLTVEAYIRASGRAIQGATSHHLGQNFSKIFEITYEDPDSQEKKYIYQNSWGITTRTIGVMIMVHGDNKGLVLPPKVASIQIVIVPCGITANLSDVERNGIFEACQDLERVLRTTGLRVKGDYRMNYSPGWKFNHWELKGVPIRVEIGPKDLQSLQIVIVRRDTGEKRTIPKIAAFIRLREMLDLIQLEMLERATEELNNNKVVVKTWSDFTKFLDERKMLLAPFCGVSECEDKIKNDSARDDLIEPGAPSMGAKSLCIPLQTQVTLQPTDKCIHPDCGRKTEFYTLFGRSY